MWIRPFALWSCDFHWHLHIKFYNPVCESNHSHNNWFNLGRHLSIFGLEKAVWASELRFFPLLVWLVCTKIFPPSISVLLVNSLEIGQTEEKKKKISAVNLHQLLLSREINVISLEQAKGIKNETENKCGNRLAAKEFTYSIIFLP